MSKLYIAQNNNPYITAGHLYAGAIKESSSLGADIIVYVDEVVVDTETDKIRYYYTFKLICGRIIHWRTSRVTNLQPHKTYIMSSKLQTVRYLSGTKYEETESYVAQFKPFVQLSPVEEYLCLNTHLA